MISAIRSARRLLRRVSASSTKVRSRALRVVPRRPASASISSRRASGRARAELASFEGAGPRCEHCLVRRARRQTFIVAEAHGGTLRQVGRSCLRAYTGKAQAVPVAALLSELEELRSELEREREPGRIAVEAFLAHAACVIRLEGYRRGGITRKAAEANYRALEDGAPGAEEPSHADRQRAERTLRWARALPRGGDDLLAKIAAAAAEPFVTAGTAGVLAYAPVAYGQARRREITRERAAAKELGEAGSRRHFSLVLEHAARLPTRFGPRARGRCTSSARRAGSGSCGARRAGRTSRSASARLFAAGSRRRSMTAASGQALRSQAARASTQRL